MKKIAFLVSCVALAATLVPALLFFAGRVSLDATKLWMLAATVMWFASAPVWMER